MSEALTWMSTNPGKAVATIALVIAFGLAACLIELWIDDRRKG